MENTLPKSPPTVEGTVVPTALKRKHDELMAMLKAGAPEQGAPEPGVEQKQAAEPQPEPTTTPETTPTKEVQPEPPAVPQTSVTELLAAPEPKEDSAADRLNDRIRELEKVHAELAAKKEQSIELPEDMQVDEGTQRGFNMLADGLRKIQKEVTSLKQGAQARQTPGNGLNDEIARLRADTFAANIKSSVKDWDELNHDMGFVAFLSGVINPLDPLKRPYAATLKDARAAGDVQRAAAVVDAYRRSKPKPPAKAEREMPKPGQAAAPAPANEKIKLSDYENWVRKCTSRIGRLDLAKVDAMQRMFHDAVIKGQVDMTA